MKDRAFAALVRKLHAAELQHLRELVAEQQATIEAQAQQIKDLEDAAVWSDQRAGMFQDLVHELQDLHPSAQIGITQSGHMGVMQ